MINIAKALIAAQKQMDNAVKDSKNPFFKSVYADLNSVREACLPSLNDNGICVIQPICQVDGKNYVKTILLHESGEQIESLTEILFTKMNDPQAQGSGITYARRYGLQSLVCIGAEDDDGNKATERPDKKQLEALADGIQEDYKINNEQSFKMLKTLFEGTGSKAELEGEIAKNKKLINGLAKYAPELFKLLQECKDGMLESFGE